MLNVAQLYNLDFKVGISGNLDQAMTQTLLLGMATTVKNGNIVLDEDQMLYMTYLYCIFMAHSVDHTVDEILMSSNTYLINSKDSRFDVVYKEKNKKEENKSGNVYAKKQNTRYCYGYFNDFFVKNRITTFYKIKDRLGNYLIDLHDQKYSFATPNSDSKIYRLSIELLNNKDDFKKVAKDIITSYKYISFDKQKEDIVKNFGKSLSSNNYEIWVGLSHQAISCFSVLDDLETQELSNAFIEPILY